MSIQWVNGAADDEQPGRVSEWLLTGSITQLVLAIISKDTRTPLERWVFDINLVQTEGGEGTDAK